MAFKHTREIAVFFRILINRMQSSLKQEMNATRRSPRCYHRRASTLKLSSAIPLIFAVIWMITAPLTSWVNAQPPQPAAIVHAATGKAANPIMQENQQLGSTEWRLDNPATHGEIEGYASLTSVNQGDTIQLFVSTNASAYRIEVFRMGWYAGLGGRQVAAAVDRPGIKQPRPTPDFEDDLIECDWKDPYVLQIPEDWVSGFYLAKLTASSGKQSYIIFVVREDDRASDFLFQSSVTTYQAYNNWGGKSLYEWNSRGRPVYEVSFNRPYAISPNLKASYGVGAGEFLTNMQPASRTSSSGWEYNMVRWLEKEGYDVTYATDIDTHADDKLLLSHRAFLAVGHDEYWSWQMRQNVEAARNQGINLGFFSSNTCYWQIRFKESKLTGGIYRTIVAYKELAGLDPFSRDADPSNDRQVTVRWRQFPVRLPEAALIGVMYQTDPVLADIVIAPTAPDWVLSNTGLAPGDRLKGLLGYEVDRITAASPPGTIAIAHSPYLYKDEIRYADMAVYQATSGAMVFATGSMQWSWGLDDFNAPNLRPSYNSAAAQQLTRNVLTRLAHPAAVSCASSQEIIPDPTVCPAA
ncbi:MAG TPA: N,N-dimethylformamidase beta subunit family domain-containing protein [Coleofasciculaceae cyanobacterium]